MLVQNQMNKDDPEISDDVLVQQALAGDQEAFEALVYRYKASLYQRIYCYVGEYDEACDVLQQVWLKLYLSLDTLRLYHRIEPWLIKVARSRSIDTLRRKRLTYFSELEVKYEKGEVSALDTLPDTNPPPEEIAERHDLQRSVRRVIQALPSRYRVVILLRYGDELGFPEIGQVLNRSESTVKTQFYRTRSSLRTALTQCK